MVSIVSKDAYLKSFLIRICRYFANLKPSRLYIVTGDISLRVVGILFKKYADILFEGYSLLVLVNEALYLYICTATIDY